LDDFSLSTLAIALAVLLVASGFFSIAETAMMAANRYRLKHRAARGDQGAKLALTLLGETDRLLGVILFGNNLLNAGTATLAGVITGRLLGEGELERIRVHDLNEDEEYELTADAFVVLE